MREQHILNNLQWAAGIIWKDSDGDEYAKDLDIITDFSIGNLKRLLNDLSYLKELAEKRIADINKTEGIINLNIKRYKEGNKKLCRIFVTTYDLLTDGYSDSEIVNEHILDECIVSDTQKTQAEIEEKIKELEEKYNVKRRLIL